MPGGQPGPAKSPGQGQVSSEEVGSRARLSPRDGSQGQMQPRDLQAGLRPGRESAGGWGWRQDWQSPWPGRGTAKPEPWRSCTRLGPRLRVLGWAEVGARGLGARGVGSGGPRPGCWGPLWPVSDLRALAACFSPGRWG